MFRPISRRKIFSWSADHEFCFKQNISEFLYFIYTITAQLEVLVFWRENFINLKLYFDKKCRDTLLYREYDSDALSRA